VLLYLADVRTILYYSFFSQQPAPRAPSMVHQFAEFAIAYMRPCPVGIIVVRDDSRSRFLDNGHDSVAGVS